MNYLLIIVLFLIGSLGAQAGEYRFRCQGVVTGLCDLIYDAEGRETTVKLDFVDPESAAVFQALQKKRIYGTKGFEDHQGVRWEQGIFLVGEFASEKKWTPSAPNMAQSEAYRDFKVTGVKLVFPVWRFQECEEVEDPSARPVFLETHFSFESLFPLGLKHEGKPIDWNKHTVVKGP